MNPFYKDKPIYGTIGYVILKNKKKNKKVIVMSDMHDRLKKCDNHTNISDWFKSKFDSSHILLEEVDRRNNKLDELWTQSEHTQGLKNLYLKNPKIVKPVDIRPFLIPFSWELLSRGDAIEDKMKSMLFKIFLKDIDAFFSLTHEYLKEVLFIYKVLELKKRKDVRKHFILLKEQFLKFIEKFVLNLGDKTMMEMFREHASILEEMNTLLDDIMEWYICVSIDVSHKKSIILHAGLAHTDKVIKLLQSIYGYKIKIKQGTNEMTQIFFNNMDGCVTLSPEDNKDF